MAEKKNTANNKDDIMDFVDDFISQKNDNATQKPKLPTNQPKAIDTKQTFVPQSNSERVIPSPKNIRDFDFDKSRYEEVVLKDLPYCDFYYPGTKILFRECDVREIQRFSQLDENSIFDFKEKLNEIIEECVLFQNPDGTLGSYEQIMDGDRTWLIYLIREKTFPKGKTLSIKVNYKDGDDTKTANIELIRQNIEVWRDQEVMQYLDKKLKTFTFETTLRDDAFIIKPPTIGLKRCFDHYLKLKNENGDNINSTFFKIAIFLKPNTTYMDWDELEEFQKWFEETLTPDDFSFLFDLIENHLKIGIRGLKKNMDTGTIRSRKMYPNKLTALFLLPNAFRSYIRKQTDSV